MKKLLEGIIDFRATRLEDYRARFAHLAAGQSPDTLMIACSDSRVAPNAFASTNPGDLFVVRNVGNFIPCCEGESIQGSESSEAAAIDFALSRLGVTDIIVCGHSDCGAIEALQKGRGGVPQAHLRDWLRHGEDALGSIPSRARIGWRLSETNRLSQINVLCQLQHLKTYPLVQERLSSGRLRLHAWWFELGTADVFVFDDSREEFVLLDEAEVQKILGHASGTR